MGFDAWFFARLDYQDKNKRMNEKELEWLWRPNAESLGTDTQIFTHVTYNQYAAPKGFQWDIIEAGNAGYTQWINNEDYRDYNAPEEAKKLMEVLDERASHYLTDDLFVLFGEDFEYMDAEHNF